MLDVWLDVWLDMWLALANEVTVDFAILGRVGEYTSNPRRRLSEHCMV